MSDDAFENIVPFITPELPTNQTESDYLLKLIATIRDSLFVPRYYQNWNIFAEERNFEPRRTLFEPFLEHFTNTYNSADTDLLQIRLATGTVVTELFLRDLRAPLEDLYLEFKIHVHNFVKNTIEYCDSAFRLLFEFSDILHQIP